MLIGMTGTIEIPGDKNVFFWGKDKKRYLLLLSPGTVEVEGNVIHTDTGDMIEVTKITVEEELK